MSIINNSQSFIPNEEQIACISKVNKFIEEHKPFSKLLINGSAGTGKTTIIISSIVNILITQIINNIDVINDILLQNNHNSIYKKINWDKLPLNIFIISAPTNKAKDVLVTKYNIYGAKPLQVGGYEATSLSYINNGEFGVESVTHGQELLDAAVDQLEAEGEEFAWDGGVDGDAPTDGDILDGGADNG